MRRSIVFPLLLAAASAAAILILALPGPAGAASTSPHIACPQGAHIIPCCPVPPGAAKSHAQPICCQTTPCCPPTTCCPTPTSGSCCPPTTCAQGVTPTINASPHPSRAGQQVVISGFGLPGAQVVLWRELPHQSSFHQVSTTTADSTGKYKFTLKRGVVMTNQKWYVTSDGARSDTVAQRVWAVVALTSSAHSTVVGQAIVLRGHVTPSHAGQRVLIETSRGSTWRVIARPRLGHGSSYKVTHRFATSGAVKLRVVFQRDSRNDRSTSSTLTLTVKR